MPCASDRKTFDSPVVLTCTRRKNVILADCSCRQRIVSSDYTQHTDPPVTATSVRKLQQAMVPGEHLQSVHLLCADDVKRRDYAATIASVSLTGLSSNEL